MSALRTTYLLFFTILLLNCSDDSPVSSPVITDEFETPQQIVTNISRGINIGNTLEPPLEGDWNNGPMQEYYFDDIKDAGFSCVRIPVRWDKHTGETSPYTIDDEWLNRVEHFVDYGLEKGLYIIINAHHEGWLFTTYSQLETKERFDRIWEQISDRFSTKSGKLLFEIINEPNGISHEEITELNTRILAIIRKNNPKRCVIFSGKGWASADDLMTAEIPADDYLLGYYHSYDPWNFAGEANGTWGSFDDREAIRKTFEKIAAWSTVHNIPVMISEFGAVRNCDYNSRMLHYYTYTEFALKNNIPFLVWDDGGDFGIYNRESRNWSEVKDILINTHPEGPAILQAYYVTGGNVYLTWQNRSDVNSVIEIQRKVDSGEFVKIAEVSKETADYHEKYSTKGTIYYRIVIKPDGLPDMYSNPSRIIIE